MKRVGEDDMKVGLIVLRGKYEAFKLETATKLRRKSSCMALESPKEKNFSCTTPKSSILVIYFFKAVLFDSI